VAQRLRALDREAPLRLVAMTGHGQEADRVRTFGAGFDAHLTKPVGVAQLRQVLDPDAAL